ncbi:unnamed protein product [Rotaria sp. Silwood2]|nr:unnamed protein product [Rotaria sp. Silwood2]CAF2843193.1 unnamed protein product [Rotaria sp. Silwood2]CAF3252784.1 unnamed protein product [Rotaria sp. Silwood2]CAF4173247.1 unnamed protein product [Rotaria sp. Silwood2]CAF4232003.1 unnamed protein product [Rotaria sp. Silwood2]
MNSLVGEGLRNEGSDYDVPCIGLCCWPPSRVIIRNNNNVADHKRHDMISYLSDDGQTKRDGDDTPIVALLLGGNSTTLSALCCYLKQGTPIVIVKV